MVDLPCEATSHMSLETFKKIKDRIPELVVAAGCDPTG